MQLKAPSIIPADVANEDLITLIRSRQQPVHITELARKVVEDATTRIKNIAAKRYYAPGATYEPEEYIYFEDRLTLIGNIRFGGNPQQGQFQILELLFDDDNSSLKVAASVMGTNTCDRAMKLSPGWQDQLLSPASQHLKEKLSKDPRFCQVQLRQDEFFVLRELLNEVSPAISTKIKEHLESSANSVGLEDLVELAFGLRDDGSKAYQLNEFALTLWLSRQKDLVDIGGRWVTTKALVDRQGEKQQILTLPRVFTEISLPEDLHKASPSQIEVQRRKILSKEVTNSVDSPEVAKGKPHDNSTQRQGVFTLTAKAYYEGCLPLTKDLSALFPVRSNGMQEILLHYNFSFVGKSGQLNARIDREKNCLWFARGSFEIWRDCKIYPGARLRIIPRNQYEYDLITRPPRKTDLLKVWRMYQGEDGNLEYFEDAETRYYDVDDAVYVADARFEDLPALFKQAENANNSIFGLMYKQACSWWEENGREPLYLTLNQIFESLHANPAGRMVSKATLAWQLWQRLAFEEKGNGSYLFKPEFANELRQGKPSRVQEKDILSQSEISGSIRSKDQNISNNKSFTNELPPSSSQPNVVFTGKAISGSVKSTIIVSPQDRSKKKLIPKAERQPKLLPEKMKSELRVFKEGEWLNKSPDLPVDYHKIGLPGLEKLTDGFSFRTVDSSLVVEETDDILERIHLNEVHLALKNEFTKLKTVEATVLKLRFGLEDGIERTLEYIGQQLVLTRERIRQIEVTAIKKLQSSSLVVFEPIELTRKLFAAQDQVSDPTNSAFSIWLYLCSFQNQIFNHSELNLTCHLEKISYNYLEIQLLPSKKSQIITRNEIEKAWQTLNSTGRLLEARLYNPCPVVGLLLLVPGVKFNQNTFSLVFEPKSLPPKIGKTFNVSVGMSDPTNLTEPLLNESLIVEKPAQLDPVIEKAKIEIIQPVLTEPLIQIPIFEEPKTDRIRSILNSVNTVLDDKYLIPGPAPIGRMFNYTKRIANGSFRTVFRGPTNNDNLDQWTVCAMVGLGLVECLEKTNQRPELTSDGAKIQRGLLPHLPFTENPDSKTAIHLAHYFRESAPIIYEQLQTLFSNSPAIRNLLKVLSEGELPVSLNEFYTRIGLRHHMVKVTAEHRIPSLLRVAEFCGLIQFDTHTRLLNLRHPTHTPSKINPANVPLKQMTLAI